MGKYLYFEICIICVLILVVILFNLRSHYQRFVEDRIFIVIVWAAIALAVCDAMWIFIDGAGGKGARCANYLCNVIYFFLTGAITYLCFLYVEYRVRQGRWHSKLVAYLCCAPFLIVAGGAVASIWFGSIFYVDAANYYHRGRWYMIQYMIAYGYLVTGMIRALQMASKTKKSYLKGEYRMLAAFSFLPVMSGAAQVILDGFPVLCVGTVIALFMIFINLQNQQISKDALSGVNNRRYLNRYLDTRIAGKHRKKRLFFILMDIDSFKEINDTYGHIAGDNAIIQLASILKEVCCVNNDFLARYGGDEFAIVCERGDSQEVENLIQEIQNILNFYNEENEVGYKIRISVGYAEYGEVEMENQDQLIALADKRLYEVKRTRKSRIVTEH